VRSGAPRRSRCIAPRHTICIVSAITTTTTTPTKPLLLHYNQHAAPRKDLFVPGREDHPELPRPHHRGSSWHRQSRDQEGRREGECRSEMREGSRIALGWGGSARKVQRAVQRHRSRRRCVLTRLPFPSALPSHSQVVDMIKVLPPPPPRTHTTTTKIQQAVFCRCWRSGTFPMCDGKHVAHNKVRLGDSAAIEGAGNALSCSP